MKWQWQTVQEQRAATKQRRSHWHRFFAWKPRYDHDSRTAYWLQFVWCRVVEWGDENYVFSLIPLKTEYRDGNREPEAPPVKKVA